MCLVIYMTGSGATSDNGQAVQISLAGYTVGQSRYYLDGGSSRNPACIATVVRNSIRYGNLDVVEEGYGINMLPLATFALKAYKDDPCTRFVFKVAPSGADNMESDLIKKMHKAIAIIRFKLEGQLIKKWPEYGMKERLLLEHIDYEQGTIELEGRTYKLLDTSFPTIDPADPYRLTEGEEEVIQRLRSSFIHCEKLKNHVGLLLKRGSMYKVYNGNLLFHGCIPMEEDGSFAKVNIYGKEYSGKALFDILETYVRKAFSRTTGWKDKRAAISCGTYGQHHILRFMAEIRWLRLRDIL